MIHNLCVKVSVLVWLYIYCVCVCVCVSDLWLQGSCRLNGKGCRDRTRREREDEGEGRPNPETRHQLLHQQVQTHTHDDAFSSWSKEGLNSLFSFHWTGRGWTAVICKVTKVPWFCTSVNVLSYIPPLYKPHTNGSLCWKRFDRKWKQVNSRPVEGAVSC